MKISIGLMAGSSIEKYRQMQLACAKTWFQDLSKVYLFCGNHHQPDFETGMVKLTKGIVNFIHFEDIKEDYESALDKQFLGLEYLFENDPADWYAIYGPDNYVNYQKLQETLAKYSTEQPLIVGGSIQHRYLDHQVPFLLGGGGIHINHAALKILLDNRSARTICQDWRNLCEYKKDYKPAADLAICYYLWKLDIPIMGIRGFYMCDCEGIDPFGANLSFDKNSIIVCHYMSPKQMLEYYMYINKNGHD